MPKVVVDKNSVDRLVKELRKLGKIISSPNLQLYRASKFRQYTIDMVSRGNIDLKPISNATKIISGSHNPIWDTGYLVKSMGVRPVGKDAADVGYFADGNGKIPGKDITVTKAAILQHTGFKIPLFGEKGARVRGWLAKQGVFDQKYLNFSGESKKDKSEKWIVIPPRPFMFRSYFSYVFNDEDVKAVDEFLNKLINSPSEDYSVPTEFKLESMDED